MGYWNLLFHLSRQRETERQRERERNRKGDVREIEKERE